MSTELQVLGRVLGFRLGGVSFRLRVILGFWRGSVV